ncbi:uncharacterized protein [Asterias amurensis]|uniref:uncharacterized protein n=1 Tax=Asterias amurensis TaxID=7602 RepID=UPI003AB66B3A
MAHVGVRDATGRFTESFEIFAKLPGPGSLTSINVRHTTTVAELKSLIELVCGIPSDLQLLSYRHHSVLTDGDTLGRLCVIPGARLPVKVTYGFDGLVDAALRGDLKEVLRKVAMTMDVDGMSQRRFVAMFIAAHKGFHYLVDRLLCDGALPNSQTPSGRTALHVACAMGNNGCIDSLLQHGALLEIKDASHQTPADTAASCGQQGAQRRVVLYARILANKATKEKTCTWSTSPRFPKSKLGSSVAPTISLKELAITPGPELMITAWKGREHHHHYFERNRRPLSSKLAHSSLFQNDSATSSTESWESLRDFAKSSQLHAPSKTEDSSPHGSKITTDRESMARSVRLHDRPNSALSSTAGRRPKSATPKSVKFSPGDSQRPPTNMDKYSASKNIQNSVAIPSDSYYRSPVQVPISSRPSLDSVQTDAAKSCLRKILVTNDNERHNSRQNLGTCETNNVNGQVPRNDRGDGNEITMGNKANDSFSNSSDQSSEELDSREINDMRINYLNDKLRHVIDLPVEHPQRLQFMKEEESKLSDGSPSPYKVSKRKPTPEENEQAFNDWLASKSQDARDRKLVNKVNRMLNDAFGKKDETLVVECDDQVQIKTPLTFEAWAEKKTNQGRLRADKLAAESVKQDQETEKKAAARLNGGKSTETWLAAKIEKQKQERKAAKQKEDEKQRAKAGREEAAQEVFKKWCMQKQWEELQMLKDKPRTKRRPKSGTNRKTGTAHRLTSTRRIRSHSAPPRRIRITPS